MNLNILHFVQNDNIEKILRLQLRMTEKTKSDVVDVNDKW